MLSRPMPHPENAYLAGIAVMFRLPLLLLLLLAGPGVAVGSTASVEHHLYIFFYNEKDETTVAMEKVFDRAVAKVGKDASALKIDINDPNEALIVHYYGLKPKFMPYVIVFGPDGAVKGQFGGKVSEQQLADAIAAPSLPAHMHRPGCSCGCCQGKSLQ